MTRFVIDYVFEGHRRGYNVTPERGVDSDLLRAVWRSAMPRGQGWSGYIGARSIKSFVVPDGRIAVSDVTVTDQADETGRQGIRRAVVDVMTPAVYAQHLQSRWLSYPSHVMAAAKSLHADLDLPRIKRNGGVVISRPYTTPQDWWTVEALMFLLLLDPPRPLRRLKPPVMLTTLALDALKESPLLAMPESCVPDDVPVLALS